MAQFLATLCSLLGVPAIIKQYVIDPLKEQISYLCCSESILDSLRAKIERLKETANNLQPDVDAARQNLETIRSEVEDWLTRAAQIKEQTEDFLENIPAEVQEGRINGICSNLKLHYSVSRDAMKMAKAIDALGDGKFERVANPEPPPGSEIPSFPPGTEFESRKIKEEEIMADLRGESVYMIGICGMGGVGKTTMVEKIWKRATEQEKLFDVVAMAVVSQQVDKKGIQKQIAKYLGLELKEDESVSISAGRLHKRLRQETSILIIIDDIWEALNLVELGIPSPGEHKGCKIILTSRDDGVCTRTEAKLREMGTTEMRATKIVSLDVLTENEAWALFKAKAGSIVDRGDLHQIAKNVAKECKGLPLALVTVGCAMAEIKNAQENPRPIWEDALRQLQRSAPLDIEEVLEKVYRPLEWSYNHLKSDEARYLFLLCCLFPEDSVISLKDLLSYGVGLRIFLNVETLREARNRVYALVGRLESRYMLMDNGTNDGIKYVKMHDVIRDVAVYIASKGEHVFMTSHGLKDWPRKDSYEDYTHISLTLEKSVMLPECINCPILKMLCMDFGEAVRVPDTFFDRMRELNVLDIENMGSLPSSLQSLTNLRTLCLRGGEMEDVSMIGQLVKLEILDLSYSKLQVLPKEIGGLEKLKSLDLRWCSDLRRIAPGVISRLVRLEELFMLHSFIDWEAEVEGKERRTASLVEVASLKNLTALHLHIPDLEVLPQDTLHWPELERSLICIGQLSASERNDCGDNNLILDLKETTPSIHALIRKADRLELTLGRMGASDELIKLIQERNEHLKSLELQNCQIYFVNELFKENNVFPKLRFLSLSYCDDLEGISFVMPSLAGSFDALEVLKLSDLCKLTHFWDQKLCLPNLCEVDIFNCSSLQCVFLQSTAESADVVDPMVFPKLKILRLSTLPSFICFWKADNEIESTRKFNSQFFFNQKVTFPSLEELTLWKIETATKIFSCQIPNDSFNRLKTLWIDNCPNLKVIFSLPLLRNFRTLRRLVVFDCLMLEEVVKKEDEELQAAVNGPLFPELKELILLKLPNFKTFCNMKNDIELPKPESISIEDCQKMETSSLRALSLPNMENAFGLLETNLATQIVFNREVFADLVEMKLSNINATKIFSSQIPVASFSWLLKLQVDSCPNLKVIFSPPIFRNLKTLHKLAVSNCSKLEEVVGMEGEESQAAVKEPLFLELKELILSKLPNFKTFCHMKNDIELPKLKSIAIEDSQQMETSSMGSLSLPRLAYVFGSLVVFNREVFTNLVEMELSNINATTIFSSQIPIDSFSLLERLRIENCSNLKVIFPHPIFRNFRTLRELAVSNCSKLEEMVRKEDEELQAAVKEPLFPELKELKLSELPNFKTFCHMKNDIELPKLKSIAIEDCQQMETSSVGSLSVPCMENPFGSLDPNLATQIVFNREVFANLVEMELSNISATTIFSSQIPIGSFSRLERLRIGNCPNLKVLFFPPIFSNFRTLRELAVSNCSELEEVVGKEDNELQAEEPLFPELRELILSKLPNFKIFCHMKNDIELPQLESMTIEDCHKMGTFSVGFLSLPCLTRLFGLMEPDLATRIFFKKETPWHDIHLKNNSFALSARDLSSLFSGNYWKNHWKLCWVKDSSDTLNLIGRISSCCNLRITGRFEMDKLSPGTLYLVVFEIMLVEYSQFRDVVKLELTQSEGITEVRGENLYQQPIGEWIEILAGEFTTGPDPTGDLEFSLNTNLIHRELLVKGVTIRPKA